SSTSTTTRASSSRWVPPNVCIQVPSRAAFDLSVLHCPEWNLPCRGAIATFRAVRTFRPSKYRVSLRGAKRSPRRFLGPRSLRRGEDDEGADVGVRAAAGGGRLRPGRPGARRGE